MADSMIGRALEQTHAILKAPERIPPDKLPRIKLIPDFVASTGDPLSKTNQEIKALGESTITRLDDLTRRGLLKIEATQVPDHQHEIVCRYTSAGKPYAESYQYETEVAVVKMDDKGIVSDVVTKTKEHGGRGRHQYTQIHFAKNYGYGDSDKLTHARMKQTTIVGRKNPRDKDDFDNIITEEIGGSSNDAQRKTELVKLRTGHTKKIRFAELRAEYIVDSKGVHGSDTVVIAVGDKIDPAKDFTAIHAGRWTTKVANELDYQMSINTGRNQKEDTLAELGSLSAMADHVVYKEATGDTRGKAAGNYYCETKVVAGKQSSISGFHKAEIHDVVLPGVFTSELRDSTSHKAITIRPSTHPNREYNEGDTFGPKDRDLAKLDMGSSGSVLYFAPSVPKSIV